MTTEIKEVCVEVESAQLKDAIKRVVFCAATNKSRPVLTGVHTALQDDTLTLATADGFRLSVQSLRLPTPVAERLEIIIPARSLRELSRLLKKQESVTLTVNQQRNEVLFRLKNDEKVYQLIDGKFPSYRQFIPETFVTRAVVDVAEFLRAAKTAAIFARDGSGVVRLYLTPGEVKMADSLRLTSRSEDVGESEEIIDALIEGPEAHIAFDNRYMTDVLGVLGKGGVALEVTGPSNPGVFKPVGDESYVHVVMPMFVQW